MNETKEFNSIKNGIALKAVAQIILYTIICMCIVAIIVDGVFNDKIAETIYDTDAFLYYTAVEQKPAIIAIISIFVMAIVSFFVIKKTMNSLTIITSAINQIIKEPDNQVKLPTSLAIIENKLNNIRIDLIRSREEAKEAESKKNDLIMYMAHDLKTPLTSVIGYLSLLTEEKNISEEMKEKYTKIALNKAQRVEELTNQFFEITRYNLYDMPINKSKIDISFLLEQLVDECYPMLQEKGLKCKVIKPENIYYEGDGDKLARAFANLIKNAINYSYENTQIEIELTKAGSKINIVFRNKGDKIPKYKLEKIFDKFYRADESRTSSTGGTGLGLAITKEIIELHGGKIYVKNDDEFIEFYIEL